MKRRPHDLTRRRAYSGRIHDTTSRRAPRPAPQPDLAVDHLGLVGASRDVAAGPTGVRVTATPARHDLESAALPPVADSTAHTAVDAPL